MKVNGKDKGLFPIYGKLKNVPNHLPDVGIG
jgi:hypothetical protein